MLRLDVGEGMCTTLVAHQQRITLAEVSGIFSTSAYANKTSVAVVALTGTDAFRDDGTLGVFTQVNHLGSGICLLELVRYCNAVELTYAIVSFEDTRRIFPSHCRTSFDLRPADFGIALTDAALGYKVEDTTFSFGIAREPVLYGLYLISASSIATSSTTAACN